MPYINPIKIWILLFFNYLMADMDDVDDGKMDMEAHNQR